MDTLSKQELLLLAIEMDTPSLINFCKSNARINNLVCKQNQIWINKLKREYKFDFLGPTNEIRNPKTYYRILYEKLQDVIFKYHESSETTWLGDDNKFAGTNIYTNSMFEAIRLGFLDLVVYLSKYHISGDYILYAAKYGTEEIVKYLLDRLDETKPNDINLLLCMTWSVENKDVNVFKLFLEIYKKKWYHQYQFESVIVHAIELENLIVLKEISKFLNEDRKAFNVYGQVLKKGNLEIAKILYNSTNVRFGMLSETVSVDNLQFFKFLSSIYNFDMNDYIEKEIKKMGERISQRDGSILFQLSDWIIGNKSVKILQYYLSLGTYDYFINRYPTHKEFIDRQLQRTNRWFF
jgi:hypothetical protein